MTEQNPYALESALRMEDIKPGLEAVVIGGGRYHHERITFQSKPFLKEHEGYDFSDPRNLKKVMKSSMMVMASSGGKAASTEISSVGDGASNHVRERYLSDMGFCESAEFGWSGKYTVAFEGYRPGDHE